MNAPPRIERRAFVALLAAAAFRVPLPEGLLALVLGSMQDGGLPQAGCYTPRCIRGRNPDAARLVASLALIDPDAERFYLVDASPDLTRQMDLIPSAAFRRRAAERRPFDGIFLTHAHMGHYLGLALLGREGMGVAPTPCYCTARMAAFLRSNGPWSLMVTEGRLDLRALEPDRWHRVDDRLSVRLLVVPHRDEFSDTVGFVFRGPARSLLYLPDIDRWERWARRIEDVVAEVDIAMIDGTFYSEGEVPGRSQAEIPHPLIPDSMARLGALARTKRIVFTHLNNTNPALDEGGPEAAAIRARGFEIAREEMLFPM